jgi:hypothetical protein
MSDAVLAEDQPKQRFKPDLKWRIAQIISWIGHPLVFVTATLTTIVILRLANRVGVAVLVALILTMVLPTALLLLRGVRSGRWSDADVSVPSERTEFYPPAILL